VSEVPRPYDDWLICMISSQVHQRIGGFDELLEESDEWAYDFGTSTATYTPEGASAPRTLRDTYLLLLRNREDGWELYREVASSALPPDSLLQR